jgi:hypothetical protein
MVVTRRRSLLVPDQHYNAARHTLAENVTPPVRIRAIAAIERLALKPRPLGESAARHN